MGRTRHYQDKLSGRFEELVRVMPPQAIADDVQLDHTIEMIDRLMTIAKLTKGQECYLETLTQLLGVYESKHHAIDSSDSSGFDCPCDGSKIPRLQANPSGSWFSIGRVNHDVASEVVDRANGSASWRQTWTTSSSIRGALAESEGLQAEALGICEPTAFRRWQVY